MRMMDELKPLFLYSATKKVYAPIDEKDRRHGSSIMLLTPNMETSAKLTQLPYVHNPDLFTSFYIDRNVMAYIGNGKDKDPEFDEAEENAVSEAMLRNWNSKIKFKYDEDMSTMDRHYIDDVYGNRNIYKKIATDLKLTYVPETVKVIVHPTVSSLRDSASSEYNSVCKDALYSYSNGEEIHLVSKRVYDPEVMGGPYQIYLKNELICNMLLQANPDLALIPVLSIAQVYSGMYAWINENKGNSTVDIGQDSYNRFAKGIQSIIEKKKTNIIYDYLKSGNLQIFTKYTLASTIGNIRKLIFESTLTYFERQRLLPSDFGVPDKRKYPIHDEDHVRAAIRMFNNCDPSDEEELAQNIIKKINKFGITDVKVSAANRFKPYYDEAIREQKRREEEKANKKPSKTEELVNKAAEKVKDGVIKVKDKAKEKVQAFLNKDKPKEAVTESFVGTQYGDIMKICSHLSGDEIKKISFYDTYRDSDFVIKRVIKYVGGEPAGFLDVYQFPSKPEIAQITIAVSDQFRGMGIADTMVKEVINSDLHSTHGFKLYYWTAHPGNEASINLARKNGFKDTNCKDKYGRYVFIKDMIEANDSFDGFKHYIQQENSIMLEGSAFLEADSPDYSAKLKQYLYNERIKNSKETLQLYEKIKQLNPQIKRTYVKLEMYKRFNMFVDLSYYHSLFLKNNTFRLDKGVEVYFDFINKLLNNREIDSIYKNKTIFIPVDAGIWNNSTGGDVFDYKTNLNPISTIVRLVRTDLGKLRKAWGNKRIVFVGSRGYFTVDFKDFDMTKLNRFRSNIEKLMSNDQPIKDDYELDDLADDTDTPEADKHANTAKATKAKMIDKIEKGTSIKVDNISTEPEDGSSKEVTPHLTISNTPVVINGAHDNTIIISIDPEGPDGYERPSKTVLANVGAISTYCMPKE